MEASFGTRLRQQRERQGIELTAIAHQTKIKRSLLEELERDDLSRWPAGLFRRSWVRDYAKAIGLNADVVISELRALYPEEPETVEAIASSMDRSGGGFPRTLSLTSWLRDVVAASAAPSRTAPAPAPASRGVSSLLAESAQALGAVGAVVWSWDARSSVLRPSCGHGYADAVLSAFPDLPRDAENAVGAAFRRAQMCIVEGRNEMTGALTVPLMAAAGCVGVLALEFRSGVELREPVCAAAMRLAADVAGFVTPVTQRSSVA